MNLLIELEHSERNKSFVESLKNKTKLLGISLIDINKCAYWDNVFKHSKFPKCASIIKKGFENLQVRETKTGYIIELDNNIKIDKFKLVDLCKNINYGSLGVMPYNIFSYVFKTIKNNIPKYKNSYFWFGI